MLKSTATYVDTYVSAPFWFEWMNSSIHMKNMLSQLWALETIFFFHFYVFDFMKRSDACSQLHISAVKEKDNLQFFSRSHWNDKWKWRSLRRSICNCIHWKSKFTFHSNVTKSLMGIRHRKCTSFPFISICFTFQLVIIDIIQIIVPRFSAYLRWYSAEAEEKTYTKRQTKTSTGHLHNN